jgi:hypothetical protein
MRIMNQDAFTITTLLIVLLFLFETVKGNIKLEKVGKLGLFVILLFFVANTLSLLQFRSSELLVHIRPYMGIISAIMLFLLTLNMIETKKDLHHIIIVIYIILFAQLLVSLMIMSGYNMESLAIFATRQYEFWLTTNRASGLIHDYELLAEWYAVFLPFGLWLFFTGRMRILYGIGIVLLVVGIVVTATRGALLSLGAGVVFFLLFIPGKKIKQRASYFF